MHMWNATIMAFSCSDWLFLKQLVGATGSGAWLPLACWNNSCVSLSEWLIYYAVA